MCAMCIQQNRIQTEADAALSSFNVLIERNASKQTKFNSNRIKSYMLCGASDDMKPIISGFYIHALKREKIKERVEIRHYEMTPQQL